MKKDPEILWHMYVKVVGGVDDALNMLSEKKYEQAEKTLIRVLQESEELYISSGEDGEDEEELNRKSTECV